MVGPLFKRSKGKRALRGKPRRARFLVIGCALVAAGVVDFVSRSSGGLTFELSIVEQRLRQAKRISAGALLPVLAEDANTEAFGEVLRHA